MGFKTLLAYQKSFDLAMQIFKLSKSFPVEERFSFTSQKVRSSRAVCAAFAEAHRKREYIKHFKSKLTDADSENAETQLWIGFALACDYISHEESNKLISQNDEVGKLINFMINNPGKFGVRDC